MNAKNLATTPTIALFLICSITGIFLFVHINIPNIKVIHEWLGLVFVVCGILHIIANWKSMLRYFAGMKAVVIGLLVLSAVTYSMVAVPANQKGNPIMSIVSQVKKAPLATIANLYDMESEVLVKLLQGKGYTVASVDSTLEELSRQNDTPAEKIIDSIATGQK